MIDDSGLAFDHKCDHERQQQIQAQPGKPHSHRTENWSENGLVRTGTGCEGEILRGFQLDGFHDFLVGKPTQETTFLIDYRKAV